MNRGVRFCGAVCRDRKPQGSEADVARHESDREDLIREAVALRSRVEWLVPGQPEPVLAGLKRDGSLSIYFGQDPVYQFNPGGELRRAYCDHFLYRTQGTVLARLHRERTDTETVLARHDLSTSETEQLLDQMRTRLNSVRIALESGAVQELRRVTAEPAPDFIAALTQVLNNGPRLAPPIATRRS